MVLRRAIAAVERVHQYRADPDYVQREANANSIRNKSRRLQRMSEEREIDSINARDRRIQMTFQEYIKNIKKGPT